MRRIPKLTNANYNDLEFVIKDFGKFTSFVEGLAATDGKLKANGSAVSVLTCPNAQVERYYFVRDGHYAYLSDETVVKYIDGEWSAICSSKVEPCIAPFIKNGRECTIIIGEQSVIVDDDGQIFQAEAPYGRTAVIYKGMLFVANENRLQFSKLFDYQNFSDGLENSGFITTNADYGKILALVPTKTVLIIVCEKAIYHLSPNGNRENYSLVKQDIAINAQENSVQNAGALTYMFSDKILCKYQGGNLTKVNYSLDGVKYVFDGQSGVDGNTYYATLRDTEDEKYLFTYNQITGSESITKIGSIKLADGGYFIEGQSVKKISDSAEENSQAEWDSVELDFNSPLVKSLVGVAVKTSNALRLELECSFDKQTLNFDKGFNLIKTNLTDKSFRVKLFTCSLGAFIERIKFIYRLQED